MTSLTPHWARPIPYGVYEVVQDLGWVNVGTDHDTASFAVESIRRWWRSMGSPLYPKARHLLFPPGTSKWNKIEHRLFSHITMNWRGRPLVSHDVAVSLIGATKTASASRRASTSGSTLLACRFQTKP